MLSIHEWSTVYTIGIIDTGINGELLKQYNVVDVYNSISSDENVEDDSGHGSVMTSIICGNGYKGITGLASGFRIVIIKAADQDGKMSFESLLSALKHAEEAKCDVVNISLGGYLNSDDVAAQLMGMYEKDITVVCSSGDYAQYLPLNTLRQHT